MVVAVWCGGRILALRQSYRRGPTFPGGALRRGEAPAAAAMRELREEVGLDLPADGLSHAGSITVRFESCLDHVEVFEATLPAPPLLRPDNREIVAAAFLDPREMLAAADLAPYLRRYLEGRVTIRA